MGEASRRDVLDGAWWPRSRDLTVELAQLVDGFPAAVGRVARVVYSPPDWDTVARRVPVARGFVKAGSFPSDDTHTLVVQMIDRTRLKLLVVPPGFTDYQGEEAMLAASTPGNEHTGSELLLEVTDQHDARPSEHWRSTDDAGSGQ